MTYMYIYVVFLLQDAQRKHITEQYKNHCNVERIGLDVLYVKEIFEICISVDWPISLLLAKCSGKSPTESRLVRCLIKYHGELSLSKSPICFTS